MIGQSSTEGERKRAARRENRALLPQRTNAGHLSDIRPPKKEKEIEIEIELEKEIEREEGRPAPAVFGKYQNVFLTDSELAELKEEKSYIVRQGMTMQEVVDLLRDEHGWSDSVSNLSNKLQRESLRYVEAVQLADALGYEIVWQRRK